MTNPNCGMCGNLNVRGFCNLTACSFPSNKTGTIRAKKPTNADRIRAMTDEELAECFWNICESYYKPLQGWLEWLKQECES